MSEGFEEIAQQLRRDMGGDVVADFERLIDHLLGEVEERPGTFSKLETVASVSLAVHGMTSHMQAATLAAVAILRLVGVGVEREG